MTSLERRALLGDTEAQRECTEKGILLPCPFCGSKATYSVKSTSTFGDLRGWGFGIECTKCKVCSPKMDYRLSVSFTNDGNIHVCNDERKDALGLWNTRLTPPVGWCEKCTAYVDHKCTNVGYYTPENGYCNDFEPKEDEENG